MNVLRFLLFSLCALHFSFFLGQEAHASYTLLIPDQPTREYDAKDTEKQLDVLLGLVDPFTQQSADMELPQMLAVVRHIPLSQEEQEKERQETGKSITIKEKREELLGDLEEIRNFDKKAWAAHVNLDTPGLYQLMMETRPHWNESRNCFEQQFVKTELPVYGMERGWSKAVGLKFEIIPLTRPFGLMAPALFTGKVLLSGDIFAGGLVTAARLNTDKRGLPSPWHAEQVVKTNAAGEFSFVCSVPGWWAFMATAKGDPLKGPDGLLKPLEIGAVFWVYIDDSRTMPYKPSKAAKTKGATQ